MNYTPIPFSKLAEQIPVQPVDAPVDVFVDGIEFQIYRDTSGYYVLVNTKNGQRTARETNWLMLEQAVIPATPAVPEVMGIPAVGSFQIAGVAAGDGIVGFNYNGIVYAVSPIAAQSAGDTAQALVNLVNLGGQMTAVLNVDIVELTANFSGVGGNIALVDVTADTTQTGTEVGLAGGVDAIPGIPAQPEQPAILSVWTDAQFIANFEPV
jgi:phage tail sheath gpL-like